MEVLIGWKKTVLILMLLWILRMEPRCVSLLDFTCLSVSTRKISVCTGMMTSLQSLTRKQADKVREVLNRISNCIYLVSQSKLCFFKLISWMLHLIFHQGNIVFTVTQQCMWMLTQPPPVVNIHLPKNIMPERLASIFYNKEEFYKLRPIYEEVLKKTGFDSNLSFIDPATRNNKRKRIRKKHHMV